MPTRKVALRQLNKLVGSWQTSVTVLAGPDSGKPISGFDSYKWLLGEMFLQHTWNVRIPDDLHRGVEIYSYDPDLQTIFAHAYNADGTLTPSLISIQGRRFVIEGGQLSFEGSFSTDGDTLTGTWSTKEGAAPIMKLTLRRKAGKV
jgi:hypothetical protein